MRADPVIIDLETRSACDLKTAGGHNYAVHPTTQFLTVAWSESPDHYALWLATDRRVPAPLIETHCSDVQEIWTQPEPPDALLELAASGRPFLAHNAWTFDAPVWRALTRGRAEPADWIDTFPLALSVGLPGGLQQIGTRLWGEGKYEEGSTTLKRVSRNVTKPVGNGELCLIGRYNVQDVRLLRWLWEEIQATLRTTEAEQTFLRHTRAKNDRGVAIDRELLRSLIALSEKSKAEAVMKIGELTGGALKTQSDLQSRTKVIAWLAANLVTIRDGKGKDSLKRELVQQFIDTNTESDDDGDGDVPLDDSGPDAAVEGGIDAEQSNAIQRVVAVLALRLSALRITGGKLKAAAEALSEDGRFRNGHVYWGAHTGREAHRRLQMGNLPRPKETVGVWPLLERWERNPSAFSIEAVRFELDKTYQEALKKNPKAALSSADDAASGMLRGIIVPAEGCLLADADFAAIEARVIAWLAGEEWLIEAFRTGQDPYLVTASAIYGREIVSKKDPRRQVGKVVELASLYGQGSKGLAIYTAAQGINLEAEGTTAPACTLAFRQSHPAIAGTIAGEYNGVPYFRGGYWHKINDAAIHCIQTGQSVDVCRTSLSMFRGHLYVTLPSGRNLVYRNARAEMVVPSYAKGDPDAKKLLSMTFVHPRYGRKGTYGGSLAENWTQAVARDFLQVAVNNAEAAGYPTVLTVHDSVMGELRSHGQFPGFMSAVSTLPTWADGFTLDAEGGLSPRYAKSPPPLGPVMREEVWRNGRFHKAA